MNHFFFESIPKEMSFIIQPAFYETWFFRGLLLAILSALLYSFFRLHIYFLIRQKEKLKKEVADRTKEQNILIGELEAAVEELEQSKEALYQNNLFREKLAMIFAHDLQSPLRFMSDAINRLHDKTLEQKFTDVRGIGVELQKTSVNIFRFVEDFGLWLSTMGRYFRIQNSWINVHELVGELRLFFTELLKIKQNTMVIQVAEAASIFSDRQLLKIILRNIIDNANKHTSKGIINISMHPDNGTALIKITDNGTGMSNDMLKKTNQRLTGSPMKTYLTEQTSMHGYHFVTDFSNLLDIAVKVESAPGNGTTVNLSNFKTSVASYSMDPEKILYRIN